MADPVAGPDRLRVYTDDVTAKVTSTVPDPIAFAEKDRFYEETRQVKDYAPDRHTELAHGSAINRANARASEKHRCDDCDLNLGDSAALDRHLKTQAHLDRLAGIVPRPISKSAVSVKALRAEAVMDGTYRCEACNHNFPNVNALQRHLGTTLHGKSQTKYDAAQARRSRKGGK